MSKVPVQRKKITSYHTISKAEMDKLVGSGERSQYKGKPPTSYPRYIEDADHVEILDYPASPGMDPGSSTRCYLYITWPDKPLKCKYLQAWDKQILSLYLGAKTSEKLFGKMKRTWSKLLHKQLLKDAKLNV